ncbi:MAG: PQQ-binding-like beta-propeller repeat protein [Planctomycetaceae bacterium]
MSDGALPPDSAAANDAAATPLPKRWPHITLLSVLVSAVLIYVFVWHLWDSPFGDSIPNLITYSLAALVAIVSLIWLARYAPFSRRTRLIATAVLLAPALGYAATVRGIEWSGDMQLIVHHRWEPTDAERLLEHRESQSPAADRIADPAPMVARPEDMPSYRGRNSQGVVVGPPLPQDWETHPPQLLWKQPCGGGYAQLAVVEPWAVTIEQREGNEAVVCYDTTTGRERWVQEYPAEFTEAMGGPGPRATPTIADGAVYSLGAKGDLLKLSLATGEVLWRRNLLTDYDAPNTEWAMSSSPLVVDDLLVVNPGGPNGDGLVALDRETGKPVWERPGVQEHASPENDSNRMGYSTPFVVELLGTRQIVMFDGVGVRGYLPDTGEKLWEHRHRNGAGVNVAQPLVFDDGRIFITCSYDVGCRMLQVREMQGTWSVESLWDNKNLRCKFTSPVLHNGYIYGLDEGILVCLDPATGQRNWKKGRYGHGQLLLTNDQLFIHSEDGWGVLLDPDPKKWIEVTKFRTLEDPKNWNPPALIDGKLYIRNHREMAGFDLCGER